MKEIKVYPCSHCGTIPMFQEKSVELPGLGKMVKIGLECPGCGAEIKIQGYVEEHMKYLARCSAARRWNFIFTDLKGGRK